MSCHTYFVTAAYIITVFLRLPFLGVVFAFRAAHSKCLLAECFVAYCRGIFCQHQGCSVLHSTVGKKNPKDMTIMEVNLTGIFKGVYVRRREGEATGWRKHY